MSMQITTVGAVIDALLAIPAADQTGVYGGDPAAVISDGGWLQDAVAPQRLVMIGVSTTGAPTGQANQGVMGLETIGLPLDINESYGVLCGIRVADGDPNGQKKCRDDCLAMWAPFHLALRTDPTLGGVVPQYTYIAEWSLNQDDPQDEEGTACILSWLVRVSNVLNGQ